MDIFNECSAANDLLQAGDEHGARNLLIQLLDKIGKPEDGYPEVLNHLIRCVGLYPYMDTNTASWQQKFVMEAFKADVGDQKATLHREQSIVLSQLVEGKSLAVSAPTSFGKSFIIDAFISARRPTNVVIIVPTIALMDETRRRLFKKFSREYNIITSSDVDLSAKNILIFPQERSFSYVNKLKSIDLLIVDEFYKASSKHDRERSPSLVKSILKLSKKADQRYYLAPNIKRLSNNIFTEGMEFVELLDFNTVYLEKFDLYKEIGKDEYKKSRELLKIISNKSKKSLVYAGTYSEIEKVSKLVISSMNPIDRPHLTHFSAWLKLNYDPSWKLADMVSRGVGVHNGQMHRSLSQLQVRVFEHPAGFDSIVSTSSIIEGVNTSAQNVIIWRSKIGNNNLKDFTYKNIIGRGGRMFKHFVGKIYLLDAPPKDEDTQLEIEFPEQILGDLDEVSEGNGLTEPQIEKIIEYKREMSSLLGASEFARISKEGLLKDSDADFLLRLAHDMNNQPDDWKGLAHLNSDNPNQWERMLYKIIRLKPAGWDIEYSKLVSFIKVLSSNWQLGIPVLLNQLADDGVTVEKFFQLERNVTYKLAALMSDVNELHKIVVDPNVDIGRFVGKIGNAFLPGPVYSLEEYGLPRMISRKVSQAGLIDFTEQGFDLPAALRRFQRLGLSRVLDLKTLDKFDRYVVRYFFDGITPIQREE